MCIRPKAPDVPAPPPAAPPPVQAAPATFVASAGERQRLRKLGAAQGTAGARQTSALTDPNIGQATLLGQTKATV